MIYDDAKYLMDALGVMESDGNFEIALEVINKYGTYKKALQATINIEYKKKEELLIALLGDEEEEDLNEHTKEAKRLINLTREINHKVYIDHERLLIPFDDLMKQIKLGEMISERDLSILSAVKPYRDAKQLVGEINLYADGEIQLQAFIEALKFAPTDLVQIANPLKNLRIKRWVT